MNQDDKNLLQKAVAGDASIAFDSKKKGKKGKKEEEVEEDIEEDDDEEQEEDNDQEEEGEGDEIDQDELIKEINEKFQPVSSEIEKIEQEYLKERLALELKYQSVFQPLYEKRAELIASSSKPVSQDEEEEEEEDEGIAQDFWYAVLSSIPAIAEHIRETDGDALRYLKDIKVNLLDSVEEPGYQIVFVFDENPFFKNKELIKTVRNRRIFSNGNKGFGKLSGTKIEWKSNKKDLTKIKPKKGEEAYVSPFSFFDFFNPETGKALENITVEEGIQITEEEYFAIQRDHEVADAIRGKVVPNAIEYFTGEMVDDEEEEGEYGDEEEEEDDEDGDEDDDDEDEDDD